jgi:hypothetical protein
MAFDARLLWALFRGGQVADLLIGYEYIGCLKDLLRNKWHYVGDVIFLILIR